MRSNEAAELLVVVTDLGDSPLTLGEIVHDFPPWRVALGSLTTNLPLAAARYVFCFVAIDLASLIVFHVVPNMALRLDIA